MKSARKLRDLFSFPGFVAHATLKGVFGDPKIRIVTLRRRKKRLNVPSVAIDVEVDMTSASVVPETFGWPIGTCMLSSSVGGCGARGAAACV